MLTQSVTYKNFKGVDKTQELYFHISKTDMMENLSLRTRMEELGEVFSGNKRALDESEIKLMLDMIQEIIKISYGIRSDDGEYFLKNEEIYDKFKHSAVYDEFLFGLFADDAEKLVKFMLGLIPPDLYAQVMESQPEAAAILNNAQTTVVETNTPVANAVVNPQPAAAAVPDLSKMTPEELQAYANRQVADSRRS